MERGWEFLKEYSGDANIFLHPDSPISDFYDARPIDLGFREYELPVALTTPYIRKNFAETSALGIDIYSFLVPIGVGRLIYGEKQLWDSFFQIKKLVKKTS